MQRGRSNTPLTQAESSFVASCHAAELSLVTFTLVTLVALSSMAAHAFSMPFPVLNAITKLRLALRFDIPMLFNTGGVRAEMSTNLLRISWKRRISANHKKHARVTSELITLVRKGILFICFASIEQKCRNGLDTGYWRGDVTSNPFWCMRTHSSKNRNMNNSTLLQF